MQLQRLLGNLNTIGREGKHGLLGVLIFSGLKNSQGRLYDHGALSGTVTVKIFQLFMTMERSVAQLR